MTDGPLDAYRKLRAAGDLQPDPMQQAAAERLEVLCGALTGYAPATGLRRWVARFGLGGKDAAVPRGLYIHGPVGRGKSMLMDLFFEHAPIRRKRRVHFYEFMVEVHDALHAWRRKKKNRRSERDPLPQIAEKIAARSWLLCFDEFHVTDIADAMILGRLFSSLFERGVVVVATSNFAPDDLYAGGLQRARFLPFIELLKQRLDPVELASPVDYRLARLKATRVYHIPLGPAATRTLERVFAELVDGAAAPDEIVVKGRTLAVPRAGNGVAWFGFAALCQQPLGPEDYLAIARRYDTVVLDGVPILKEDTRNEARRFMTLIDTLYEQRVNLVMSAQAAPQELYRGGTHSFEFERTVSRLMEMQSDDYLRLEHRPAS
jgi:cell division protein ZapE